MKDVPFSSTLLLPLRSASRFFWLAILAVCLPATAQEAPQASQAPPDMILVSAGEFLMGSERCEDEKPTGKIAVAAFYIDKHEVTNQQYAAFLTAAGQTKDGSGHDYFKKDQWFQLQEADGQWRAKTGQEKHPVVNLTWFGAAAYAQWAGKQLPTEAEWEKAARGTDGRQFPWGETWDARKCVVSAPGAPFDGLAPVGSVPAGASACGCLDMAGNAGEWTSSLYKPYPYHADDGREDPQSEDARVVRGGAWTDDLNDVLRASARLRNNPMDTFQGMGFRCAKSVPE